MNIKNRNTLYKYRRLTSICLLFIALLIFGILLNYRSLHSKTLEYPIIVTVLDEENQLSEGNEIWIEGVNVNGTFYAATQIFETGWIVDENKVGWKEYDRPEGMESMDLQIRGSIPYGKDVSIIFESNKWRGKANVAFLDKNHTIDCYAPTESGTAQLDFVNNDGSDHTYNDNRKYNIVLGCLWLLEIAVCSILCIYFYAAVCSSKERSRKTAVRSERIVWIDILRIFCVFTVVLLHVSVSAYEKTFSELSHWYAFLYVNCFTGFAVPVLFMVSGRLIIRQEEKPIITLFKRLKKILVPLFIWSIIYIFMRKEYLHENINVLTQITRIGTEPQYYHLWFIYTLTGVYLLSPIISFFYYSASKKMLFYSMVVFGVFPLILWTAEQITSYSINISFLYAFFPEIFLFLLGKIICDSNKKIFQKWYLWLLSGFFGYGILVVLTYYFSLNQNAPVKIFFSNYGTLPVFIMYVSIFCFFYSLKAKLDLLKQRWKKIIGVVADACMSIYFSHMLIYTFLNGKKLFGVIALSLDSTNLKVVFLMAVMCFMISLFVALLLDKGKDAMDNLASKLYK